LILFNPQKELFFSDCLVMNFLFIHQCFPMQFIHTSRALAESGHRVVSISQGREGKHKKPFDLIQREVYRIRKRKHSYLLDRYAEAVAYAEAVVGAIDRLTAQGFVPDLVIGHAAWGEMLYLRDVWPKCPLLGYFEIFHGIEPDETFDPEQPLDRDQRLELRTASAIDLISLNIIDRALAPTVCQRNFFPRIYWNKFEVIHEGVDTDSLRPNPDARVWVSGELSLSPQDEVLTYCSRSLEPHRGFLTFMRALPEVMRRRPKLHVVIVGRDETSYSDYCVTHKNYREKMVEEVGQGLDMSRVHFFAGLRYHQYIALLQVSSAHVYLTHPFTLSWSLTEAMSLGCLIVGSRTSPVEEVIVHGDNGFLVDFFDCKGLAAQLVDVLRNRAKLQHVRVRARETILKRFDLRRVCLPQHLRLYNRMLRIRR
jgi:glycosyltransferase involved in cell wall biosynthesis